MIRRRSGAPSSLSLDDVDEAKRLIDEWEQAGFDYLVCGWPGAGHAQIEAFAKAVLRVSGYGGLLTPSQ